MKLRPDWHIFNELAMQHHKKAFSFHKEVSRRDTSELDALQHQLESIKLVLETTDPQRPKYTQIKEQVRRIEKIIEKKKNWTL